jgi:hypothetical protein
MRLPGAASLLGRRQLELLGNEHVVFLDRDQGQNDGILAVHRPP